MDSVEVAKEALEERSGLLLFDVSDRPPSGMNALTSILADLGNDKPPVIAMGTVEIFEEEFQPVGDSLIGRLVKPLREREIARNLRVWKNAGDDLGEVAHAEKADVDHQIAKKNPLNLLIIDEKAISRKVLMMSLASFGYRADGVEDLELAKDAIRRRAFDLIFVGEESGESFDPDAIEEIRRFHFEEMGRKSPLAIYICSAQPEAFEEVVQSGLVDGVLRRPTRWHMLRELLASYHS